MLEVIGQMAFGFMLILFGLVVLRVAIAASRAKKNPPPSWTCSKSAPEAAKHELSRARDRWLRSLFR